MHGGMGNFKPCKISTISLREGKNFENSNLGLQECYLCALQPPKISHSSVWCQCLASPFALAHKACLCLKRDLSSQKDHSSSQESKIGASTGCFRLLGNEKIERGRKKFGQKTENWTENFEDFFGKNFDAVTCLPVSF